MDRHAVGFRHGVCLGLDTGERIAHLDLHRAGGTTDDGLLCWLQPLPDPLVDEHDEFDVAVVRHGQVVHHLVQLAFADALHACHAAIDRTALVGEILSRAADVRGGAANVVDELLEGLAKGSDLEALEVLGSAHDGVAGHEN